MLRPAAAPFVLFLLSLSLARGAVVTLPFLVFHDDFESGPGGWTTGSDGATGTAWELGAPSTVGPPAAHSATNCYGTNIADDYALNANVWLRSPALDLTGLPDATLRYFEYADTEVMFDPARVSILSARDLSAVAVLQFAHDSVVTSWQETSFALPPEAFAQPVVFEFRLRSDDIINRPGWYIDDVQVTSSIPEPSVPCLVALAGLAFLPRSRRRR